MDGGLCGRVKRKKVVTPWLCCCHGSVYVCVVFTDAFTDAYLQLGFTRIERYVCRCYCFI